ncbi:MAG: UvrD-helicase domain-containing protein [bacterium]
MNNLGIEPTEEQREIIQSLPDYAFIKVNAFAGTGKTSTLQLLTNKYPEMKFLYLAYNKSIQLEASKKFGGNVQVKTVHSLAYKYVSKYTDLNLTNLTNYFAKDFAKQFNLDYKTAQKVCRSFLIYCNSSESEPERQLYAKYIKMFVERINLGQINPSFDYMLKKFHLLLCDSIKIEKFDTILLDEAQDSTDVIIDIFMRMSADHKVLVGDKHQQIYSFRDSKNAMERFYGKELPLTKTFRFPTNIAKYSNTLLSRFKGETLKIKSNIDPVPFNTASTNPGYSIGFISRGNSSLITKMLSLQDNNEKFKTVRQPEEIFRTIKDVGYFLDKNRKNISSQNSFLRDLTDERDLRSYIKSTKDFQLESTLRTFQTTFSSNLSEVFEIESLANEYHQSREYIRYFLTTAHTSKGLEFDCTVISDDFFPFEKIISESGHCTYRSYLENIKSCDHKLLDEFNLFYVALTRCKKSSEIFDNNIFYLKDDDWEEVLESNIKKIAPLKNSSAFKNNEGSSAKAFEEKNGLVEKGFLKIVSQFFFGK